MHASPVPPELRSPAPDLRHPRIAILSSGLGHTARGIEAWAKSLAEALHREGEDVILLHGGGAYTCPNIKLNYLHRDTLPIRLLTRLAPKFTWRWGLTSRYGLEQRLFTRAFLRWLTRQSAPSLLDIIHTQDYVVAKRLSRHPTPDTRHSRIIFSNVTDEPPATLAGLPYLQHVSQPDYDAALAERALSERSEDHAVALGEGGPLHFLVPSFVNTTHFTPATPEQKAAHRRQYGIPEDAFVIGCVAALQRHHKRLDSLIDEVASLASLPLTSDLRLPSVARKAKGGPPTSSLPLTSDFGPPSSVHLLLAGATTDDTATIERHAQTHLNSNVTILKDQPFNTMPAIYQSMDLLVHPAPEEVFGICLLESMACGIPVIAHHSPRLQYVVGEGGWLTDVTKPGFLGELWERVREGLPDASVRSRRHVEARFSWGAVYLEYLGMYREVVG